MDNFFDNVDRRGRDRFRSDTLVQYFIKKRSMRYMDCRLIDISRTGIAIELPASEEIEIDLEVSLEISVPGSLDQITVFGFIKRIQRGDKKIAGIKFKEILDPDVLSKLIMNR